MSLSRNSTLQEVFDFIILEDASDVQVMPVTISESGDDTARLMIIVQGHPDTAHNIMANLMVAVQDMHDLAEQAEHSPGGDGEPEESQIIGTDGEILGDDGPEFKIVS